MSLSKRQDRRVFLGTAASLAGAATGLAAPIPPGEQTNVIGPRRGYSEQIGTLVSMMFWMRDKVTGSVRTLGRGELDYLLDKEANSIGALLLHLAATETYYQLNTFEGQPWGSWDEGIKKKWDIPMGLGRKARETIRGHDLDYYLKALSETRAKTLDGFRKRDDKWLMSVDERWPWGPTNNYCKWFHVFEHESHHNGQIVFLASRAPGPHSGRQ